MFPLTAGPLGLPLLSAAEVDSPESSMRRTARYGKDPFMSSAAESPSAEQKGCNRRSHNLLFVTTVLFVFHLGMYQLVSQRLAAVWTGSYRSAYFLPIITGANSLLVALIVVAASEGVKRLKQPRPSTDDERS